MSTLEQAASEQLLAAISRLQDVQKRHRPDSAEWLDASEALAPLFAEMARRQDQ